MELHASAGIQPKVKNPMHEPELERLLLSYM